MQYIITFYSYFKTQSLNKELKIAMSAYTGNAQEWVYQQASLESSALCFPAELLLLGKG